MHKTRNATIKPKKIVLLPFVTPTCKLIVVIENEQKSVINKLKQLENFQKSMKKKSTFNSIF